MKKVIFILAILICPFTSFSDTITPASWKKGNGTEKKPYLIESAEHLYYLSLQVNNGNDYEHIYFRLTTDIDLQGNKKNQWKPIGSATHPFKGNFNGNHFEIINLYIATPSLDYVGFFGYVLTGNIENTGISINSSVTGKDHVGGIVGYQMDGSLSNCYNKARINGKNNVGGIVGYQYNTIIKSSYNTGPVNGKWYVGGIAGMGYGNTHIINCYNTGNVNGEYYIGGIIGKIDGYRYTASVTNCYQESIFDKIGLIGTGISIEVLNCYHANVSGMKIEKFGTVMDHDEMKSDSFLIKLSNGENIWTKDKEPFVNSGYPILASMKYNGIFTNEATGIAEKTATLHGNFISEKETIISKGFEYKAENSSQFTNITVESESFSFDLTDLTPYTKYTFRAFVITDKGKITGRNIEFHTLAEKCGPDCGHKHQHHHIFDH